MTPASSVLLPPRQASDSHHAREPVQLWSSQHGPGNIVRSALAERRLHDLRRPGVTWLIAAPP